MDLPEGAAGVTNAPEAASPSRARASDLMPALAFQGTNAAGRHHVRCGPGDGLAAKPVPPDQTLQESTCRAECRGTVGTTTVASPQQQLAAQPSPAGWQRCPAPSTTVQGCDCAASDPACWWHIPGAAPGKAHRAKRVVSEQAAPDPPDSCAVIQVAGAALPVRAATRPSVQAFPRSGRRRDHPHRESRGPHPHRSAPARSAVPEAFQVDHHGDRSAAASG